MHNDHKFRLVAICASTLIVAITLVQAAQKTGETLFNEHCVSCHAGGGNIIKPDKTLRQTDREKSGIKTAKDISKFIRTAHDGMPAFDKKTISDKEAKSIAEYIIKTYR